MKTTIRIAPHDAALVIRANGTLESWLPHLHTDPPANAVAASALMCAYFDERIMSMITHAMASAGYEYPGPPIESVTEPRNRSGVQ
jgi:hypothetical protein